MFLQHLLDKAEEKVVSEPERESEEVHGAYGDLVAMLQQIILHDYQTTLTQVLAYVSLNSYRYTCLCNAHVRALIIRKIANSSNDCY